MACTLLCLWSISGEKCTERFRSGLQKMQEYIGSFGQRWYCLCPSSGHPGWTVERKDVRLFQEADESFRKEIIKVNKNEISDRAVNLAGTIKTTPDIKSLSRSWIWLESLRARQNICNWFMESFSILYDQVHLFCRFFYFFQDPCCIRTLETLDR